MADKAISDLTQATYLDDASLLVVEQNGEAQKMTGALLKDYAVAAAKEQADRAEEAVSHYPKIQNDTWWVWDASTEAYVDTGVVAAISTEMTLADRTTGTRYVLYVDNGKLMMVEEGS